ncbi:hypothetical protein F2P79_007166 [Pimephales promelas]|nr:hypothetical protein F2P79_007166 [Pimephales promelas]
MAARARLAACLCCFSRVSPSARRRVSQGRGSCPCPAPSATSSAIDICIPRRAWSNIFRDSILSSSSALSRVLLFRV